MTDARKVAGEIERLDRASGAGEKEEPMSKETEPRLCQICGEPMPKGEEMFNYHGYSGPCPKPPTTRPTVKRPEGSNADEWALFLEETKDAPSYVAVQIAEAIESARLDALAEAAKVADEVERQDDIDHGAANTGGAGAAAAAIRKLGEG